MADAQEASTSRKLRSKIRSTYKSGDQSAVDRLTRLLARALRNGNRRSISDLGKFFGLSVSKIVELDFDLVYYARLFVDGSNAHSVETWINSYASAEPDCQMRSVYENNLLNFISARRQLYELKSYMNKNKMLAK